jgi:hypothetical protein
MTVWRENKEIEDCIPQKKKKKKRGETTFDLVAKGNDFRIESYRFKIRMRRIL